MTNAIIHGISNADYHAISDRIGSSGLKELARSPYHYWAKYVSPDRIIKPSTPAQIIGTAVHTAVLEPHLFDDQYTVLPEGIDRRTKEGKSLFAEIEASGKHPLKPDEMARIRAMQESAHANGLLYSLINHPHAEIESTILFIDPETGAPCRIRPDFMILPCDEYPFGLLGDLKSTADASPAAFGKSVWSYGYHIQAALYRRGFMAAFGTSEPPDFFWPAIENDAPHASVIYQAPAEALHYGDIRVTELLELYNECRTNNHWPAYGETGELTRPGYARREIELAAGDMDIEIEYEESV